VHCVTLIYTAGNSDRMSPPGTPFCLRKCVVVLEMVTRICVATRLTDERQLSVLRHPGTPSPRHPAHRHPGTPAPGTPAPRQPGTPAPRHPGTPTPRHPGHIQCASNISLLITADAIPIEIRTIRNLIQCESIVSYQPKFDISIYSCRFHVRTSFLPIKRNLMRAYVRILF
jgi:hypothetical protein